MIAVVDLDDDPLFDHCGPYLLPRWIEGRHQAVLYAGGLYLCPEPPPCPGEGKCHGCMTWCAWCGTVMDVCDANEWPERCDRHQRYPRKPEPPKPDPRQLYLPGFGVAAPHGREL